MRAARGRLASSFMLMVLFVQTGTASPLASCVSAPGGHRDTHDHDLVASVEHGVTGVADHMPVVTWRDASHGTSPVSESCVATAHCALNLPAPVSAGPEIHPNVHAVGEPGPSWFLHVAPITHGNPPPKA